MKLVTESGHQASAYRTNFSQLSPGTNGRSAGQSTAGRPFPGLRTALPTVDRMAGDTGYTGPAAPPGSGSHRYRGRSAGSAEDIRGGDHTTAAASGDCVHRQQRTGHVANLAGELQCRAPEIARGTFIAARDSYWPEVAMAIGRIGQKRPERRR